MFMLRRKQKMRNHNSRMCTKKKNIYKNLWKEKQTGRRAKGGTQN